MGHPIQRISFRVPVSSGSWVRVKTPSEFRIERYNLTKAGRVASGQMLMDLIAKKRRFVLSYEVISSTEMQKILDIIDTSEMFFDIEYVESGFFEYATCYVGAIPSRLFRTGSSVWYWKDVEFNVIER